MLANTIRKIIYAGFIIWLSTSFLFVHSAIAKRKQLKLVSVKTSSSITLDAKAERAWNKAKVLKVKVSKLPYKPSNGYTGMKATTVKIRSLYDQENIYFLVQYKDPTLSLERFPWVKQADGSWKQLSNKDSTGHDNTYYEDKVGIFFNVNARGFKKKGCDVSCHMTEAGMNNGIPDKSAGRKYTKPGQTIDMWHWKGVRTNPLGLFDDQFVDSVNDPKKNKNWGRHGDHKLGGGYKNNVNGDKTRPAFMNRPASEASKYFVMPNSKVPFVDTFQTGDVVPGIVLSPFTGSRGDIKVKGVWKNGVWTLEFKRKLVTTGEHAKIQDVQFDNLKKAYYFGVSVFDNSQINHIYHKGPIKLTFK
jgi:hypothetical protein